MKFLDKEYTEEINGYIDELIEFVKNARLSDARAYKMDDVNRVSRFIDEDDGDTIIKLSKGERAALSMSRMEVEELVSALTAMKKEAYPFDLHRYEESMEKDAAFGFKERAHALVCRYLGKANERAASLTMAPKQYTGRYWRFVSPSYAFPEKPNSDGIMIPKGGKSKIANRESRFAGLSVGEMTYSRYSDLDYYETKAPEGEDRLLEIKVTCDDIAKRWSIEATYKTEGEDLPRTDRFEADTLEEAARMFSYAGDKHLVESLEDTKVSIVLRSEERKESKSAGFSGVFGKKDIEAERSEVTCFEGTVSEVITVQNVFHKAMASISRGTKGLPFTPEMARSLNELRSHICYKADEMARDYEAFQEKEQEYKEP